ncbi:MAG: UDP-N-acetylglucosamine 1-carboxyvinyltransferase [Phycisphaerae bacterium]|nr:UDP-N-acetylglucosamine 1-carboxyvinyltransferase [Phycisphaerae bacterium]
MDALQITGGNRLRGTVRVGGAKNAALPQMAAALMADGPVALTNMPNLADVRLLAKILGELGVESSVEAGRMTLTVTDASHSIARYDLVRQMRASICVLGPLLAKRGKAVVSMPGGCAIGDRPVDLHLRGLAALGASIHLDSGNIVAEAKRLKGAEIFMGGPFGSTVLGTANVMSAAALADGVTTIEMAACEPEVADLGDLLNAMGARITGHGTPRITIEGVPSLGGAEHPLIADRIEAGTFMVAAAITNGEVTIENCRLDHLMAVVDRLRSIGVNVESENGCVTVSSSRRLAPVDVVTQPFPGFPTDLQAQLMALLCLADGNSIVTEKIYPDRFMHVAELNRMGAHLRKEGPTVIVEGVKQLIGAPVMASDLRASAALVLAGLCARGRTRVSRVYHIDRGYERIEQRLQSLGADIERVNED